MNVLSILGVVAGGVVLLFVGYRMYDDADDSIAEAAFGIVLGVVGFFVLAIGLPLTIQTVPEAPKVEQTENVVSEVYIVDQVVDNPDNFIFIAQDGKTVIVPADKVTFEVANGSELVIVNTNDAGEVVDAVFYLTKERMAEY